MGLFLGLADFIVGAHHRRMRITILVGVAAAALLALPGCESFDSAASSVRQRFEGKDAAQTRTFAADSRATYDAVKSTAARMGFRYVRGGAAQGIFEGLSGVAVGEVPQSAQQRGMKVQLKPTLDGKGTEVTLRLTEIIEEDSSNRPGQATETALRDTPQYQVFFRQVEEALNLKPTAG